MLAFAELPTIAELEEKATAIRDLVAKRRERDREESAVQALTQEATDARNVANRLGTEFAELQKLVELDQAARVGAAEESTQALAVSLAFAAIPEPDELEVKAQQLDNQIRARQERHREATEVEQLRLRAETARKAWPPTHQQWWTTPSATATRRARAGRRGRSQTDAPSRCVQIRHNSSLRLWSGCESASRSSTAWMRT